MATLRKIAPTKKICFVSGTFPPVRCGIGDYTARLVETLTLQLQNQETDIELEVLTTNQTQVKSENFKLLPIMEHWNWKNLWKALKLLEQEQPTIVHFQYPTALYTRHLAITVMPWLLNLTKIRKATRFLTIHEYATFRAPGKIRIWLMALPCRTIITVSDDTAYRLRFLKTLGKRIKVIPIGSNISSDTPLEYQQNKEKWRQQHGLATQKPVIAYFGYISHTKGLETLIKAFAQLKMDTQLLLIAERKAQDSNYASYFETIDNLIKENHLEDKVFWTGFATEAEVAAYLQSSIVAVLPFDDGASLRRTSLIAALTNGVPTISTQPASATEAQGLKDGENIKLVSPQNPSALAQAIEDVINNPLEGVAMGQKGREFSAQFNWGDIANRHLALYQAYLELQ